ncbi:uncharacterized protein LOC125760139 [Rhipicephalus sanguineus]|uniref:uncharacterized protein LOC125760139 n=1 Tax=Rhipicephalus sanguineus TaxID=34632 RepID=UPI0020C52984|nr:uncharacterized protein LOC125760139 [Rhipicephalus sanguineus]
MADALRPAETASFLLKCAPLVVLVLFAGPQTSPNNFPQVPRGPYWTLLNAAELVLLLVSAGLSITKGSYAFQNVELVDYLSLSTLREATSNFAMAISLALLTLLVWRRWRQCLPPSGFAGALLGLLFTACVLDVFCQCTAVVQLQGITLSASQLDKTSFIVSLVVLATVMGNFVVSEIQDLVIKKPNKFVNLIDEDTSSLLARQSCSVLFP